MSVPGVDPMVYDGILYDGLNRFDTDLPFYRRRCQDAKGPILELCCGTGRLTLPLAQEGFSMTGLDCTPTMLQRAQQKAAHSNTKVTWVLDDMRSFSLDQQFALIFIPFNSLQHIYTISDLKKVFDTIARHLAPHGRFVFDVFNPSIDIMVDRARTPHTFSFQTEDGRTVNVQESCGYNAAEQINHVTWRSQISGEQTSLDLHLDMRCFWPYELELLMELTGWRIEHKFGSFDEEPYRAESAKQIFICRR